MRRFPTDDDEALAVSRRLRDLHAPGTAWSRLAVLARTNAQLDVVAHRLTRAGIPFHIRGGRPVSSLSAFRSLLPPRTDVDVRHLRTEAATMLATSPDAAERTELRMILDATDDYLAVDQRGTVAGFIEWAAAAPPADQRSTGDAVELASFHRAKGLEWSAVFVIGLEHGLVPLIGRGPADADQAEERRLLYVALTRASDELHCSWAGQRRMGSDLCDRTPSPWLAEIAAALDTLEGARRATDPRQGIRALREVLASAAR